MFSNTECSYCLTSDDCYTSGEKGEGVKDADFVLYVTAISTKRCDSVDTLAYAAHCQQEALLDSIKGEKESKIEYDEYI
ncbi:hypothetical protein COOONC_28041 [Cooperia oncophora]